MAVPYIPQVQQQSYWPIRLCRLLTFCSESGSAEFVGNKTHIVIAGPLQGVSWVPASKTIAIVQSLCAGHLCLPSLCVLPPSVWRHCADRPPLPFLFCMCPVEIFAKKFLKWMKITIFPRCWQTFHQREDSHHLVSNTGAVMWPFWVSWTNMAAIL